MGKLDWEHPKLNSLYTVERLKRSENHENRNGIRNVYLNAEEAAFEDSGKQFVNTRRACELFYQRMPEAEFQLFSVPATK